MDQTNQNKEQKPFIPAKPKFLKDIFRSLKGKKVIVTSKVIPIENGRLFLKEVEGTLIQSDSRFLKLKDVTIRYKKVIPEPFGNLSFENVIKEFGVRQHLIKIELIESISEL